MTRPVSFPLDPNRYRVTSTFGLRNLNGRKNDHLGADLATPAGIPLPAVLTGHVSKVGGSLWHSWGYHLHIADDAGNEFEYHVLDELPPFKVGDPIRLGQTIGHTGSSGAAWLKRYAPHFHGGARTRAGYYDPLTLGYHPDRFAVLSMEEAQTMAGYDTNDRKRDDEMAFNIARLKARSDAEERGEGPLHTQLDKILWALTNPTDGLRKLFAGFTRN